jgi:S1-C subfamily serine protease
MNARSFHPSRQARWFVPTLAVAAMWALAAGAAAQDPDAGARERVYYQVKPAVVLVSPKAETEFVIRDGSRTRRLPAEVRAYGSGWLITPSGFLVTNGHVVADYVEANEGSLLGLLLRRALARAGDFEGLDPRQAEALVESTIPKIVRFSPVQRTVEVYLQNGQRYQAEIKQYSPPIAPFVGKISLGQDRKVEAGKDVAVLKIEGQDFPTVRIGDSEKLQIGANVYVAGYPGGVLLHGALNPATGLEASFTRGQISSLKMALMGSTVLQFDAAIGRGNSGGPVFNDQGEVVGMTTFGTLEHTAEGIADLQGFNFAVPSSSILEFVRASGADVQQRSLFDRTWDHALSAFYERRYPDAIAAFDHALRLIPNLPDAVRLRRIAMDPAALPPAPGPTEEELAELAQQQLLEERIRQAQLAEEQRRRQQQWLLGGLLALGLVGVGGIVVHKRRQRYGAQAAAANRGGGGVASTPGADRPGIQLPGRLIVQEGPEQGHTIPLTASGIRIGRDPKVCQLVLTDGAVSREHVLVMPNSSSSATLVRSLSRTNPTLLNDQPVATEATLKRGDRIRIGNSVIVFDGDGASANGG